MKKKGIKAALQKPAGKKTGNATKGSARGSRILHKIEIGLGAVLLIAVIVSLIFTINMYMKQTPMMKEYFTQMLAREMQARNATDTNQFLQANVEISVFSMSYVVTYFSLIIVVLLQVIVLIMLMNFTFKSVNEYYENK